MKKWVSCLLFSLISVFVISGRSVCAVEISDAGYQRITYQGSEYVYNAQITAILYMGIDSDGELATYNRYSVAPRADTIDLLILDDYHKKIKLLVLSRDTIATIDRFAMNGEKRDPYESQIGYAFSYGDGGKSSCVNMINAVSRLLGGVPIHEYVATNNSSVKQMNELAGNITVTIPNDDLAEFYPEMTSGNTVTLDASNVEDFVRYRDVTVPFSNYGRMEWQEAYIREYMKKFRESILSDPEHAWNQIETMKDNMLTSITKNQYLKLADLIGQESFSDSDCLFLEGENVQEELYEAFYPDEKKLQEMIVELFYLEDGVTR